jgi:ribosomal protein L37AE/L43A
MGGTNDPENLVSLSAREHFICHLLLVKMVDEEFYPKMVYAAWQLSRPSKYKELRVTSRLYDSLKRQLSDSRKGRKRKPFSEQARLNMKEGAKHRKKVEITEERLLSIREAAKKRKKLVGEANPFYGKSHTQETIEKVREVNSRVHICPHCGKEGASNSMKRWHFDKCKLNPQTRKVDSNAQY